MLEGGVNVCFEEEKFDRIQRDYLVLNPASDTCSSVTLDLIKSQLLIYETEFLRAPRVVVNVKTK